MFNVFIPQFQSSLSSLSSISSLNNKKENVKYILLIMNCVKYKSKALYQKETWLKYLPNNVKYFHVIGNPLLTEPFMFDLNNNLLIVKTPDDYVSLPKKVIKAYSAVNEKYNFDYIFKTDDDQILVDNNFFQKLIIYLNNQIDLNNIINYGGFMVNVKNAHYSSYYTNHPELPKNLLVNKTIYCSGRFYFLSKFATNDLIKKEEKICNEYLEDYAIGYYLEPILKNNMYNFKTTMFFTDIELSDYPIWLKNSYKP